MTMDNPGVFRIFKDEDGLSEPTTWKARTKAARTGAAGLLDATAAAPAGDAQVEEVLEKSKQD